MRLSLIEAITSNAVIRALISRLGGCAKAQSRQPRVRNAVLSPGLASQTTYWQTERSAGISGGSNLNYCFRRGIPAVLFSSRRVPPSSRGGHLLLPGP